MPLVIDPLQDRQSPSASIMPVKGWPLVVYRPERLRWIFTVDQMTSTGEIVPGDEVWDRLKTPTLNSTQTAQQAVLCGRVVRLVVRGGPPA